MPKEYTLVKYGNKHSYTEVRHANGVVEYYVDGKKTWDSRADSITMPTFVEQVITK